MSQDRQLQKPFLQTLCNEGVQVAIYLVNGIKLQGVIELFDDQVVLLKSSTSQMIYKHAISTIVPSTKIMLEGFDNQFDNENSEKQKDD